MISKLTVGLIATVIFVLSGAAFVDAQQTKDVIESSDSASPTPGAPAGAQAPSGSAVTFLDGTASWDIEMVQEYVRKKQGVDMRPTPEPYANQYMLKKVNPEFAKRIDALMAIYQAHGGETRVGVVPGTGTIRSAEKQIELFKLCRRIKKVPSPPGTLLYPFYDTSPLPLVGDGSKREHWELIPVNERVAPGLSGSTRDPWSGLQVNVVLRGREMNQNCPATKHKAKQGDGYLFWYEMGPATKTWVSWHNFGLAVDIKEVLDEQGNPQAEAIPHDKAWEKREEAIGFLGMISGEWWLFHDPGHVEWHPKLHNPEKIAGRPGHASGTAITDAQIHPGYQWKIPKKIFMWNNSQGSGVRQLRVLELVKDGNWISLEKMRDLFGQKEGEWRGTWYTFAPPVKLFPAYIPTVELHRSERYYPEDVKWRGKTVVISRSHEQSVGRDGRVAKKNGEVTSEKKYGLAWGHNDGRLKIQDWQMVANQHLGKAKLVNRPDPKKFPELAAQSEENDKRIDHLYKNFRDSSVYTIELKVTEVNDQDKRKSSVKSQRVDAEGFTQDFGYEANTGFPAVAFDLLAWNRDDGKVGAVELGKVRDPETGKEYDEYDLKESRTVTDRLPVPEGTWDVETPPDWAPVNPRPKKPTPSGGGFLPK